jgi:hypothetical protein
MRRPVGFKGIRFGICWSQSNTPACGRTGSPNFAASRRTARFSFTSATCQAKLSGCDVFQISTTHLRTIVFPKPSSVTSLEFNSDLSLEPAMNYAAPSFPAAAAAPVFTACGPDTAVLERALSNFSPSGLPNPVHASHPEPALNAPLLPWVMS